MARPITNSRPERRVRLGIVGAVALLLIVVGLGAALTASGLATSRDDALTVGLLHLYYGEDQAAVKQLTAAEKVYPNDPEILAGLALAWQESGNGVEAAGGWRKVADAAAKPGTDASSLRGTLLAMAGEALRQSERLDEADRLFAEALRHDPKVALALAGRGRILSSRERWTDAVSYFKQALTVNEDYTEARYELGRALRHLNRAAEAAAELKKVVTSNSTFARAYLELGLAYRDLGRVADAQFALSRALNLDPSLSEARTALESLPGGK